MGTRCLAVVATVLAALVAAGAGVAGGGQSCATIRGGTIVDSAGNAVSLGYDEFGYNYQAHMFNGTYDSSDRVLDGMYWGNSGDYVDDSLIMKWSDTWLANVDCDGDGKLDRGLGTAGYDGIPATVDTSRGWLTNQNVGDYTDANGVQHYTYFAKIVWVGPGGPLWGQYKVIQEVYNDPAGGFHGLQLKVGAPGFGLNDGWTSLP